MVMASQMESGEYSHGTVVALEGDDNLIGTQLRLLPISSKILIINSLLDSIPQFSTTDSFDARLFVRHVHRAFSHRTKTARSFLQSSTSHQPRLVFMNGGSIGARTTCLAKICEKVTNGDLQQAELIFEDIVKGGVTGLMTPNRTPEEIEDNEISRNDNKRLQIALGEQIAEKQRISEDPSVIAMRAAELLDRATASLEPSIDIGAMNEALAFRTSWRSSVMEIQSDLIRRTSSNKRHSDSISELSRGFSMARSSFGNKRRARKPSSLEISIFSIDLEHSIFDAIQSTLSPITPETKRGTFGPPSIASYTHMTRYSEATIASESFRDSSNLQQSESVNGMSSIPPTPVILEFGEDCAVDLHSSQSPNHIKSVDKFSMVSSRLQATTISPSQRKKHNRSSFCFGNRSPSLAAFPRPEGPGSFRPQPHTVTVETSKTAINRSIVEVDMAPKDSVGRGTNPIRWDDECVSPAHKNHRPDETAALQPVFPAVEDLIIHLDDGGKNDILQAVIKGYKNGGYLPHASPKPSQHYTPSPVSLLYNTSKSVNQPASPIITTPNLENKVPRNKETPVSYQIRRQRVYAPESEKDFTQVTTNPSPPTPTTIPPPTINTNPASKLRDFDSINVNAVEMQSSLRTTLNGGLPEGDNPRQHPSSYKDNRRRRPVYRKDDAGIPMVDQIISLGCDEGVSKSLVDNLTAKIEGLGMKPNCEKQTGRLDIRKLVASAMQTFTSLPLTSQTSNPFKNPRHLAVLLIPHLEKYLTKNPSIRFLLLTFDMTYLSTMLAMRNHIGVEILKVSVVVISAKFPPRSSSRPVAPPGANIPGKESTLTLRTRPSTPQLARPGQAPSPHISFAPPGANTPGKESTLTLRSQSSIPQLARPRQTSTPIINSGRPGANVPRNDSSLTLRSRPSAPQLARPRQATGPLANSPRPQSLGDAASQHGPVDFMLIAPAPYDEVEQREKSMEFFIKDIQKSVENSSFHATPTTPSPSEMDATPSQPAQKQVKKHLAEPYTGIGMGITGLKVLGINPPIGYGTVVSEDEEDVEERERQSGDALEKMFMPRRRAITLAEKKNSSKAMKMLGLT